MADQETLIRISTLSSQVAILERKLLEVQRTADAAFTACNTMTRHIASLDMRISDLETIDADSVSASDQQHLLIPDEFPWRITGFGCRALGTTVRVMKGTVRYHGKGDFAIAQTDVLISSGSKESPMWVYVRGTAFVGFTLATSMSEPKTDNVEYKFPLCSAYNAGDGTNVPYHAVITYYAQVGDICLITPLR